MMNPKLQLVFFLLGASCFLWVVVRRRTDPHDLRCQSIIAAGWLLFAIPFVFNTAVEAF